jgi:hypothetical protein
MATERRPGITRVIADVRRRKPHLSAEAISAEAKAIYCSAFIAKHTASGLAIVKNPLYRGGKDTEARNGS